MTTLDTHTTIGQLVTDQPARARLFETLDIDYCCGGKRPLEDVCREHGLDPQTVVRMLQAIDAAGPHASNASHAAVQTWNQAPLAELANHIEATHHAYLRRELPRLQAMVRKVAAVHGSNHPWLLELDGVFAGFAAELESHMMKEEQVLFPLVQQLEQGETATPDHCGGSVMNPIRAMEHEHEDAGRALSRMRELSDGYTPPAGACNTFRAMLDGLRELEADMHQHVHKENNILFPRALECEQELQA